jgi:Mrp family chromosome partitioning ATPase
MALFHKREKSPIAPDGVLTLRSSDDAPLYTFPTEVVNSVRHMETGLVYKSTLPKRISMIAALRGEGVTYTTLALATTLAYDLAVRVCVVELNWWAPGMRTQPTQASSIDTTKLSRTARRAARQQSKNAISNVVPAGATLESSDTASLPTNPTGLAGVLMETTTIDKALIQTALPNLALLPAGDLLLSQRPVMARSDALKTCIEQLSQHFDHVLLDIPAILNTSDAIAMASLGSACCLIIRQGVTPMSNVRLALDDVKHLPILGVVLNQNRTAVPRWVRALVPQE